MKWMAIIVSAIVLVTLMLRYWRYTDDRAMTAVWTDLTATANPVQELFDPKRLDALPDTARRFFESSIGNTTPLHTVVEISMHGEFSLGDKSAPNYLPMKACQLLAPPFGFIWHLKAGKGMMQFTGSDAAFPEGSWTRFWLFGLIPVVRAGGTPDHALSSFGRYMSESLFWSPASLLPSENVVWTQIDANTASVSVTHEGYKQDFEITLDANNQLEQVRFNRWTNANTDKAYKIQPFGGYLSDFKQINGYVLPTTVVAGNHFGTEEYFPFFKAKIDSVKFVTSPNSQRSCFPN